MNRVPIEIAVLNGRRSRKATRNPQSKLTTAGAGEAVLRGVGGYPGLQGFEVKQKDARARTGGRRELLLELLKVGLGPLFALGERQRRIAKGGGEIERIAGADPGDVMRAQRDQLLNAGHRVGGGGGRQRADLCEAVGTGKLGLIVAADGQCDEIARTKSLAAGRKGITLVLPVCAPPIA